MGAPYYWVALRQDASSDLNNYETDVWSVTTKEGWGSLLAGHPDVPPRVRANSRANEIVNM